MVDESEGGESRAGAQTAAVDMAMAEAARVASVAEEARALLREQTELSRLQLARVEKLHGR